MAKRKKFRLSPQAERVMIEHQDQLERIMRSKRDLRTRLLLLVDQFDVTQGRLRELQRWGSVSLDGR